MSENIFYEILNRDSVFIDKNKISPHYIPQTLPFRDNQINTLSLWLSPALKGERPHNIFIYGKVGTGKTTVVKNVVSNLENYSLEHKMPVKAIYLNCRNYQTKYSILAYCVQLFYPENNFFGYSKPFIYDKFITYINEHHINLIVVLDEIDKIKENEIDDLIYSLTRSNDELAFGGVSVLGISNNLFFKSKLDPRTKSSLCELEDVYPPYNSEELQEILRQRVALAFKKDTVTDSAINAAAAIAAKESGDARTAVMLLLRGGELADLEKKIVTDKEVINAKEKVDQDVMKSMVLTLPVQLQIVLLSISQLYLEKPKGIMKITGALEANVFYSGEVYEKYQQLCSSFKEKSVSLRWFREYIDELETYGFITTTISGKGIRGNTTLIKLCVEAKLLYDMLANAFNS